MKHLHFNHEPEFAKPSMEGLWEDIKAIFKSTDSEKKHSNQQQTQQREFEYFRLDKVEEFFFELQKRNVEFKEGSISSNNYTNLFIENGKPLNDIVQAIQKQTSSLKRVFQQNTANDKKFSTLVKTVISECNKSRSQQDLLNVIEKYKNSLYNTPVSALKSYKFFLFELF